MVSLISYGANGNTYVGLSLDDKPTEDVTNGSCFLEMNTGKIYFYNEEDEQWVEWGA